MVVNDEPFSLKDLPAPTLMALLSELQLSQTRVAVEINGKIIQKRLYSETSLGEMDKVEIIHFAGGG